MVCQAMDGGTHFKGFFEARVIHVSDSIVIEVVSHAESELGSHGSCNLPHLLSYIPLRVSVVGGIILTSPVTHHHEVESCNCVLV